MESMRDIKRRIASVKNTQKITRAMKMVAAARLRKAQQMAENARPFFNKTRAILSGVFQSSWDTKDHPLVVERNGNRHLYLVITADRGLCGPYNTKVIDRLEEQLGDEEEVSLLAIGKRGRDYFKRQGYHLISEYIQIADYPDFSFAKKISDEVLSLFGEEIIDRVSVIYTHFNSAISQSCRVIPLLPVVSPEPGEESTVDYIYEPSPDLVLELLLPHYVNNMVYTTLLESKASEFGSRMTAMDSATDNAGELIDKLTLYYNRARQAAITTEITEIVGGAEALK